MSDSATRMEGCSATLNSSNIIYNTAAKQQDVQLTARPTLVFNNHSNQIKVQLQQLHPMHKSSVQQVTIIQNYTL